MSKISGRVVHEFEGKEDMVQAVVGVLDRTFGTGAAPAALARAAEFFRGLDERTLRALAYRQGVFEGGADTEDDEEYERE
jgi:hypothetical protein